MFCWLLSRYIKPIIHVFLIKLYELFSFSPLCSCWWRSMILFVGNNNIEDKNLLENRSITYDVVFRESHMHIYLKICCDILNRKMDWLTHWSINKLQRDLTVVSKSLEILIMRSQDEWFENGYLCSLDSIFVSFVLNSHW